MSVHSDVAMDGVLPQAHDADGSKASLDEHEASVFWYLI